MKIDKQFVIANLNRNLKSKMKSEEIEIFDFNERSDEDCYPTEVINFIKSYKNKIISVSDEVYYDLFNLSLFKEKDTVLINGVFDHIFWYDKCQSEGTYYITDSQETLKYKIYDYFMLINTYYSENCPHYEYFFKLDESGNLLLPDFTGWEVDSSNITDNKETREIYLGIL